MTRDRAVSPVVAVTVLVAVVFVLAAAVGAATLAASDHLSALPPHAVIAGEPVAPHSAPMGGIVRLTHRAGAELAVADLAIVVDASDACGKVGRLVGLPLGAGNDIDPANVRGADVFDGRSVRRFGSPPHVLLADRWERGQTAVFRIPRTDCPLTTGDRLGVRIVHRPTQTTLTRFTHPVA